MPFTLNAAGSAGTAFTDFGSTYSLSLSPYTTQAGDCIVIAGQFSDRNGVASPTPSGCGATWTTYTIDHTPMFAMMIGVGATAGGTAVEVDNLAFCKGAMAYGIFGGVSTVIGAHVTGDSGASNVTSLATASLTYPAGPLIAGGGGYGTESTGPSAAWSASSWSDGNSNTNASSHINSAGNSMGAILDYEIPPGASSTMYTASVGSSPAAPMRVLAVILGSSADLQVMIC